MAGRVQLFTDVKEIDSVNIVDVLREAYNAYLPTITRMEFLLEYEKGKQPLNRKKLYRKDIDVCCVDNVANEITEFKTGFIWGNPITFIQRGKKEEFKNDTLQAIAELNRCYDEQGIKRKTQHLARNVEITGLGYTYIDINIEDFEDGDSYFQIESIDPRNAFVVYSSYYADRRPMLGVLMRKDKKGLRHFTCFSKSLRFELNQTYEDNNTQTGYKYYQVERSGESNPLGVIPVIEWFRDYDRMGCFERQISEMDNLNLLVSDFTNDVEQNTQAIWHTNDVDFPTETITSEDGKTVEKIRKPKTNEWMQTFTSGDGKTPFIKALSIDYDYEGMLQNIITRRALILQKCNVPARNDNSGGSTGLAMNTATGYEAAETSASRQQNIMETCKMDELKVVLRAIRKHPNIKADNPLLNLRKSDVTPNIKRQKTYELSIKVNSISTLLSHGFALEDVVTVAPLFEDPNEVINRSGAGVKKYQEANVFKTENQNTEEKRPFPDISDQEQNSPNVNV